MIRFGTSGWRAVLGEEFTFPNARRVVTAIARVTRASGGIPLSLVLASDTRFLNERSVDEAFRVLVREGVRPLRAFMRSRRTKPRRIGYWRRQKNMFSEGNS